MNKVRRKELQEVIEQINIAKELLENIMCDEEEYRDNMPENLQSSEKYEKADAACDAMQEAINELEEAVSYIETAQE